LRKFWSGNTKARRYLGDASVDERILSKWVLEKHGIGGEKWMELAQGRVLFAD
jgi:hypothetical protein